MDDSASGDARGAAWKRLQSTQDERIDAALALHEAEDVELAAVDAVRRAMESEASRDESERLEARSREASSRVESARARLDECLATEGMAYDAYLRICLNVTGEVPEAGR